MKQNVITYNLPAFWACYLFNDDATYLTDKELLEIQDFLKSQATEKYYLSCIGCETETTFAPYNDANSISCEVAVFSFVKTNK